MPKEHFDLTLNILVCLDCLLHYIVLYSSYKATWQLF